MPPLLQQMKCRIYATPKGEIILTHEEKLPFIPQWVECDLNTAEITIIHDNGDIKNLGINLTPEILKNIKIAEEITFAHITENEIKSFQTVKIVIQNY